MQPPRKIRRVSSKGRPEDGSSAVGDDTTEILETEELEDISSLVAPEVAARIHAGERRFDDLSRRFKAVSDDAARAIGKAVQLTDELETLKNETLENMQVAFDENAEILEAIERDVTELKAAFGDGDKAAIEQLERVREEVEGRLVELEAARDGLTIDVHALRAEADTMRASLAENASQDGVLDKKVEGELEKLQLRIEELQTETQLMLDEVRMRADEVAQGQAQLRQSITDSLGNLQEAGLGATVGAALTALSAAQKEGADKFVRRADDIELMVMEQDALRKAVVTQLEMRVQELAETVEGLQGAVSGDVGQARETLERVESTLASMGSAATRADEAAQRVEGMEARLQEVDSQLTQLATQLEESVRLSTESRERINVAFRLADEVENKIRRLIAPLDDALVELEAFEGFATEGAVDFELRDLLEVMIKHAASDLHLKVGSPPMVRLDGELIPVGSQVLTEVDCKRLILGSMGRGQRRRLMDRKEIDFAYSIPTARFRVNAFLQRGTVSAAFRMLRQEMQTLDELGLPPILKKFTEYNNGLILVTGPAGAGKSTTLASMIDYLNQTRKLHVITVEDPIEFVHQDKMSIITQREVGADTPSFQDALKQALRQDPNVILIGEMRDPETIMTAAIAAETGHLVLSTLHTPNTIQAIDRMQDVFTGEQQKQFRLLLAKTLRGVVSQRLLTRADEQGRVPAVEVLVVTPTIASLILEGKSHDIYEYLQQGASEGMQTFTESLTRLYQQGLISREEAMYHADQPTEFRLGIEGHSSGSVNYSEGDTLMNWL